MQRCGEAQGLLLSRHDRDTFADFLRWVASDAERLSSLGQVATAVRTFLPQTRLADWSADDTVATLMGQLMRQAAEASEDE